MSEPAVNQPQGKINPQVTEKVTQALLAYRKFMETVSKLEQEEHKLFIETVKKVDDRKIQELRRKLSELSL